MKKFSKITSFLLLSLSILYILYFPAPFVAIPSVSMEPNLKVGDLVLVKKVSPKKIQIGDIIIVSVPKETQKKYGYPGSIVHRVVNIEHHDTYGSVFHIKGDNNKSEDPFAVFPEDVQGKVDRSIPHAGQIILFLHSQQGKIMLLTMLGMYLLYHAHTAYMQWKIKAIKRFHFIQTEIIKTEVKDLQKELKALREVLENQSWSHKASDECEQKGRIDKQLNSR